MEDLGRGCPAEDLAGTVVDLVHELVEFGLGEIVEAGALGEVAAQSPVEVLVAAALPGGVRVSKIGWDSEVVGKFVVECELGSVIGSDGTDSVPGQTDELADLGVDGGPGSDLGNLDGLVVAARAFNARVDASGAVGAEDAVGFPMPELLPLLNHGGPVMDRGVVPRV